MALWGSGVRLPSSPRKNPTPLGWGFNCTVKKFDHSIKFIQGLLKKNGVKMSAIEVRELMRTGSIKPDEKVIISYVNKLRHGAQYASF